VTHKTADRQITLRLAGVFRDLIPDLRRMVIGAALIGSAFAARTSAQSWGDPVWSDEFNSAEAGSAPDPGKWIFDVGASGWGNHEFEFYCAPDSSEPPCDAKEPNAFQNGHGALVIRAKKVGEEVGRVGAWTSARLKTQELKTFQYGRMESCIKLPVGAGIWPAFWMLGTAGNWPAGGEIDIMENIPETGGSGAGLGARKSQSTIHGPSTSEKGRYSLFEIFTFPSGQSVDDSVSACHAYGAIWSPFMLQMYVDDWREPFFIRTAADVPPGGRWVFNAPFYFLMNLAVGGDWPGPPNSSTPSPADMLVDYVRVYNASRVDGPKMIADALRAGGGTARSTILELRSAGETGFVFLACELDGADNKCNVDTGNALNHSVVNFRSGGSQKAKITVASADSSHAGARPGAAAGGSYVMVTAYTVSGEQSQIAIPIE
jgi:beta-glucanase (GH16 family)